MSNWQSLGPQGAPVASGPVYGGGGRTDLIGYRSILDARRAAATVKTPEAEYPDGYLGNVNSRREDRLLKGIQSRLTQRSYQRGIHKGERIDPSDYFWPTTFNPQTGLDTQATGLRFAPLGVPEEQIHYMGKRHMLSPQQLEATGARYGVSGGPSTTVDPIRAAKMQRLLPDWS
jgi:hypothetical protein